MNNLMLQELDAMQEQERALLLRLLDLATQDTSVTHLTTLTSQVSLHSLKQLTVQAPCSVIILYSHLNCFNFVIVINTKMLCQELEANLEKLQSEHSRWQQESEKSAEQVEDAKQAQQAHLVSVAKTRPDQFNLLSQATPIRMTCNIIIHRSMAIS